MDPATCNLGTDRRRRDAGSHVSVAGMSLNGSRDALSTSRLRRDRRGPRARLRLGRSDQRIAVIGKRMGGATSPEVFLSVSGSPCLTASADLANVQLPDVLNRIQRRHMAVPVASCHAGRGQG